MDPTTKDKLDTNLANAHKMASNWIMTAAGTLGVIWFALPPDQQQALIQHSPLPPWAYPIALSVIGIAGRLWPQKSISAPVAAAKSDPGPTVPPAA